MTGPSTPSTRPASVTVGIACHSEDRWGSLLATIASARAQEYPHRIVVAVDHNPRLYRRLLHQVGDQVTVVENRYSPGASGARNTIGLAADTDLVAFLDDDVLAEPGWLAGLVDALGRPGAVGAGGTILPRWEGPEPRWFPREFGWVVGATFHKETDAVTRVRNVWAANMIVRGESFVRAGGFRTDFGKLGDRPEPEDTELCLRMARTAPDAHWVFVPAAVVHHRVPAERSHVGFFLRRCWREGRGKASLARLSTASADRRQALAEERGYLRRVLPRGVRGYLRQGVAGDLTGFTRAAMVAVGVAGTGLGFVAGALRAGTVRGDTGRAGRGRRGAGRVRTDHTTTVQTGTAR